MPNIIPNLLHFLENSHRYEVEFSHFYQLWNGITLQSKIWQFICHKGRNTYDLMRKRKWMKRTRLELIAWL